MKYFNFVLKTSLQPGFSFSFSMASVDLLCCSLFACFLLTFDQGTLKNNRRLANRLLEISNNTTMPTKNNHNLVVGTGAHHSRAQLPTVMKKKLQH